MSISDNNLILIKNEDKTYSVRSWRFDNYKPVVFITYDNGKEYPYNIRDVQFLKDPQIVLLDGCIVLKDGLPLSGAVKLMFFGDFCRILYRTGYKELIKSARIRVVASALQSDKCKQCFEYLKQIADRTGLIVEGQNILSEYYRKIDFVREDSVLATFLKGKYIKSDSKKNTAIIYPFGFNLSQKKAVENALYNDLSIIEGPPGTGKTQTILNIIANAVMRDESVAVVSSNNSATDNVLQKLKKYGVDFIVAPLGNSLNKENFLDSQTLNLPDMRGWHESCKVSDILQEEEDLNNKLALQNELAALSDELNIIEKEYAYFVDFYRTLEVVEDMPQFSKKITADKILNFIAEYEVFSSSQNKLGIFKKLRLKLAYGIKNGRFYGQPVETVISYCQNMYYKFRLAEISRRKTELQTELHAFNFDVKMKHYAHSSMQVFKAALAKRYGTHARKLYEARDLWRKSEEFIKDYPVVLSTAYSLRASLSNEFVYDYVIIDEASQVDIATGALALSCAKKAVIVGDLKQLPNVVNNAQKAEADKIFEQYKLPEAYRYSNHSLLLSFTLLFPNAPHVLLREHYRCHPEIIGFCNQRFYNNELIVLTKPDMIREPLKIYRTVPGNHARGHVNQRQIEVITDELIPREGLNPERDSIGVITPYRAQADELKKVFINTAIKADTVDKFQGQEKDTIIFSTVDNEIGEFASDPNRLNVAVSRAVNQFIVVTDGNDNDKKSPIHELIGYIQYHNHEVVDSEIRSVFDYLYSKYADVREKILRKYGRVSDVDSENLMYSLIRDVLSKNEYTKYDVVMRVPLRILLNDLNKLSVREIAFATNHLTHVDFLIFSCLTHQPILVIEVDGFSYHNNEKQRERDSVKDVILHKYNIPILRLSTVGSREKEKLIAVLKEIS